MAATIDKEAFGKRVAQRRKKLGWSQGVLGKKVDVPQQTIGNVESGKVERPGFMIELAAALRTTPNWLWYAKGPEEVGGPDPVEIAAKLISEVDPSELGPVIDMLKKLKKEHAA